MKLVLPASRKLAFIYPQLVSHGGRPGRETVLSHMVRSSLHFRQQQPIVFQKESLEELQKYVAA